MWAKRRSFANSWPPISGRVHVTMSTIPRTCADVEGFINLMLVACEDATINSTWQDLLSLSNHTRKAAVHKLLEHLRATAALPELIDAITCLRDDEVAEKAFQSIYHCERLARQGSFSSLQ